MNSLAGNSTHRHCRLSCIARHTRQQQCSKPRVKASDKLVASTQATDAQVAASSNEQYTYILPRQTIAMFASGAVLGPFCDGLHSQHDVLHYVHPSIQLQLQSGALQWSFETCWWVPLLFGVAGVILGVSVPVLDDVLKQTGQQQQQQSQEQQAAPLSDGGQQITLFASGAGSTQLSITWPAVLFCISLFILQYNLSGILEQPTLNHTLPDTPIPTLDALLFTYAVAHWYTFDRTPQGLGMSALTAVCGPCIEILLINVFGLYSYSHPAVLGVPTWIPWVYFCGGPAVGNLGRLVWRELAAEYGRLQQKQ